VKPYRIPTGVYQYLQDHPFISGKDLSEALGIPGRTARRYVKMYVEGAAVPKEDIPRQRHEDAAFSVPSVQMRTAVFDIEVTDFKTEGYKGFLVCCSILSLDSAHPKTFTIRFEERGDDRRLLHDVLSELCTYDIVCGHNIAAFDLPWLYSRALYHKVRGHTFPLRRWAYFDTFQTAKALGLSTSKSLGNLSDFFGLNGIKTRIYPSSWSDPTTLVVETEHMDGQEVVQLALYDSPELEGIGIFLTEDRVLKLKRWLDRYLGVGNGTNL